MSKKQHKTTLNFRWTYLIHKMDYWIFWICGILDHWLNYFKQPLKSTFGYILGTQKLPSVCRSIVSFLRGCNRFLTSNAVWTVWLLGTSLAYCCVFLIWLWVMFLHSPSEIVLVPPAPSDLVSGFLPRLWMLFLFSLSELLGGHVEDFIQFFELVGSTFVYSCI